MSFTEKPGAKTQSWPSFLRSKYRFTARVLQKVNGLLVNILLWQHLTGEHNISHRKGENSKNNTYVLIHAKFTLWVSSNSLK